MLSSAPLLDVPLSPTLDFSICHVGRGGAGR